MQCVSDLVKLRDSIIARVRHLRQVAQASTMPLSSSDARSLAFATIELDNLIVVGLRQYAKSSLLRSRTAAGLRISATVQPASAEEAAACIYNSLSRTAYVRMGSPLAIREKDELVLRNPKDVEKVFMEYSTSNITNLVLALSLNSPVFTELKICRHFFAHRAKNTFEEVRNLAANVGVVDMTSPEHFLVRGRPGTGVKFIEGWLSDVENFFDLAA